LTEAVWKEATMTNGDFIADPTDHLIAILDDREHARAAERELSDSGFGDVRAYHGDEGGDEIDATGSGHGVTGGLVRGLQQALSNKDSLAEYEEAAREGATVLAVPASDQETRDRATAVLRRHGARGMNHFGKAIVTTIEP